MVFAWFDRFPRRMKMAVPFLSFIIPAYNVEQYLGRMLDSILGQCDGVDYEIIIVDDCSTDDTCAVAESYVERNPNRVRFIRLPQNGGVSRARNAGKNAATGTYLWFVDADDVILPGGISYLVKSLKAEESDPLDLLTFKNVRFEKESDPEFLQAIAELSSAEASLQVVDITDKKAFCWAFEHHGASILGSNSVCRKDACKDVEFRPYPNGEDVLWGTTLLLKARRFAAVPVRIYGYYNRPGSALNTWNLRHLESILQINFECFEMALADSRVDSILHIVHRRAKSFLGRTYGRASTLGGVGVDLWYRQINHFLGLEELFPPLFREMVRVILRLRLAPLTWLVFRFPFVVRGELMKNPVVAKLNRFVNDWRSRR